MLRSGGLPGAWKPCFLYIYSVADTRGRGIRWRTEAGSERKWQSKIKMNWRKRQVWHSSFQEKIMQYLRAGAEYMQPKAKLARCPTQLSEASLPSGSHHLKAHAREAHFGEGIRWAMRLQTPDGKVVVTNFDNENRESCLVASKCDRWWKLFKVFYVCDKQWAVKLNNIL